MKEVAGLKKPATDLNSKPAYGGWGTVRRETRKLPKEPYGSKGGSLGREGPFPGCSFAGVPHQTELVGVVGGVVGLVVFEFWDFRYVG